MPKDHRLLNADGAKATGMIVVQVRAANSSALNGYPHLPRSELILRQFIDSQVMRRMNNNGAHIKWLSSVAIIGPIQSWPQTLVGISFSR